MASLKVTKLAVPTTGTYAKRAESLRSVLHMELERALGPCTFESYGSREEPNFVWKLPYQVSVGIRRYRDADPNVHIRREDPVRQPPGDTDWKHVTKERDCDDQRYDIASIVALVEQFVDYNRRKRQEHEANELARARELEGLGEIPKGMMLVRDPKTGLYEFGMDTNVKGLTAEEARVTLYAARDFRTACPKGKPPPE